MELLQSHSKRHCRPWIALVCLVLATKAQAVSVAGPKSDATDLFETKIRPLLADNCYQCHSASAASLKGGLRLDEPELVLKGGKSGVVVVPGDPDGSLLVKAVGYTDPHLKMPPKGKR